MSKGVALWDRRRQTCLIVATLLASWLGMQAVHELGHVFGAVLTGGRVAQVVWHPLTISRTDLAFNPEPLVVVWSGPIFGVLAPLAIWSAAVGLRWSYAFWPRFFAGFCLIANGAYIGGGAYHGFGDCGAMCRHGSPLGLLWTFGLVTVPMGLWLWHRQGVHFGLGSARGRVDPRATYVSLAMAVALVVLGVAVGWRD